MCTGGVFVVGEDWTDLQCLSFGVDVKRSSTATAITRLGAIGCKAKRKQGDITSYAVIALAV